MAIGKCSLIWQELRFCFPVLSAFSCFRVNNGEQTIFWENKWIDGITLKYTLPELCEISVYKKLIVARTLSKFKRNYKDLFNFIDLASPIANKIYQQMHEFMNILEPLDLNSDDDVILWPPSTDNLFSVKTCYALLNDGGLRSQYRINIWKRCAPP